MALQRWIISDRMVGSEMSKGGLRNAVPASEFRCRRAGMPIVLHLEPVPGRM